MKLIIHATNVHQGGGESLLRSLANVVSHDKDIVFLLDERMRFSGTLSSFQIRKAKPNVFSRLLAEWWLRKNVGTSDVVICFGNLPPLFRLSGYVAVFLQNRYLIDDLNLNGFPIRTRLRLMIERFWFLTKMSNVNEFVVQTPSMKRLLALHTKKNVYVLPFMASYNNYSQTAQCETEEGLASFDFLYVASGEPHKNHRGLIEAWRELAAQGLFPTLKLTLDKSVFPELCEWIEHMVTLYNLNVENSGKIPCEKIFRLYKAAGALIYPSMFESFGLPLLEASQVGLPILASELDYVRDVITPDQTFDPRSAVSIARAVKRHLGLPDSLVSVQDTGIFVQNILTRASQSGTPNI